jgi:hypothetical protein
VSHKIKDEKLGAEGSACDSAASAAPSSTDTSCSPLATKPKTKKNKKHKDHLPARLLPSAMLFCFPRDHVRSDFVVTRPSFISIFSFLGRRKLSLQSKEVLAEWFDNHVEAPYPTGYPSRVFKMTVKESNCREDAFTVKEP